mmetsp:Transcript_42699/g.102974  ORF Transcript_42699/g.102974 Transcript_42699/m.102974 type:complete len:172 (-) Transcript_42699:4169-4684(-)
MFLRFFCSVPSFVYFLCLAARRLFLYETHRLSKTSRFCSFFLFPSYSHHWHNQTPWSLMPYIVVHLFQSFSRETSRQSSQKQATHYNEHNHSILDNEDLESIELKLECLFERQSSDDNPYRARSHDQRSIDLLFKSFELITAAVRRSLQTNAEDQPRIRQQQQQQPSLLLQ